MSVRADDVRRKNEKHYIPLPVCSFVRDQLKIPRIRGTEVEKKFPHSSELQVILRR
jgi:hypothetical protein